MKRCTYRDVQISRVKEARGARISRDRNSSCNFQLKFQYQPCDVKHLPDGFCNSLSKFKFSDRSIEKKKK